jgi:hypothetical protein
MLKKTKSSLKNKVPKHVPKYFAKICKKFHKKSPVGGFGGVFILQFQLPDQHQQYGHLL